MKVQVDGANDQPNVTAAQEVGKRMVSIGLWDGTGTLVVRKPRAIIYHWEVRNLPPRPGVDYDIVEDRNGH